MPTALSSPTMVDVAKAAGVGVATVDRVFSGRAKVRPQTSERVLKAARELGYERFEAHPEKRYTGQAKRLGFVLLKRSTPFYRFLAEVLIDSSRNYHEKVVPVVEYLDHLEPDHVASTLRRLGETVDAVGVVSTDHPIVAQVIEKLHGKGVPTFALVSDLSASGYCAGYVGVDCRKAGRTAAWAIARMARPGPVGIVTGSHRYVCQELFEISFRSYFREKASDFQVVEPLFSQEEPSIAAQAVRRLLEDQPNLAGLYVAGGGIEGILEVLREHRPSGMVTVCHDLTSTTRAALIDGTVDLVLSLPRQEFAQHVVHAMMQRLAHGDASGPFQVHLPSEIHTPESV
ncbi:transcriptional regulator, LacI family [Aidingimonas halophila]|uniref:Transcriptional regulator, LacI family n=1 Tax=Aidingimonas halophila TaxID=574349 RepID=A0A1H2ZEG6_9GAMM|nr:transcriptional regulator, LacI family [Aidingimonas halophila]